MRDFAAQRQRFVLKGVDVSVRVLVVEDSRQMRELLCSAIETIPGAEVVGTVSSETDATDWLYRHPGDWDVAILDLVLQDGSGFNLISRATRALGNGKAVVLSEYVTPIIARKCIQHGADAAFTKSQGGALIHYLEALVANKLAEAGSAP